MKDFDLKIREFNFEFKRVFHGSVLKYHVTYKDVAKDKATMFIMAKENGSDWRITPPQALDIEVHELEGEFRAYIIQNEMAD